MVARMWFRLVLLFEVQVLETPGDGVSGDCEQVSVHG